MVGDCRLRQDPEVGRAGPRRPGLHLNVFDPRAGRPAAQGDLETRHRLGVPAGDDFDAAVLEILHGAGDALATGRVASEVAESDALHTAGHQESFSDQHEPLIIDALMGKWRLTHAYPEGSLMSAQHDAKVPRRQFLQTAAAATAGFTIVPRHVLAGSGLLAPSDRFNVAGVGIGGMGRSNLINLASQNIVALCDADWGYAGAAFDKLAADAAQAEQRLAAPPPAAPAGGDPAAARARARVASAAPSRS